MTIQARVETIQLLHLWGAWFPLKWQGLSSWLSAFIYPLHFRSAFCTGSQHSPYGNKTHAHAKWECLPLLVLVSNMIYLFQWQGPVVKDIVRPELRVQRVGGSASRVTCAKGAEGEWSPKGLVGSAWITQIIASTLYCDNGDRDENYISQRSLCNLFFRIPLLMTEIKVCGDTCQDLNRGLIPSLWYLWEISKVLER